MSAAQKPALEVVAYGYENTRPTGEKHSLMMVKLDNTSDQYPELAIALVRLTDHEAACEALRKDAERWQYVRHHWSNAQMHWNKDATNSLKSIVLTIKTAHWTSGADELDAAIDAALVVAKGAK